MNFGIVLSDIIGKGVQGKIYRLGLSGDKPYVVKQFDFSYSKKDLTNLLKFYYEPYEPGRFSNIEEVAEYLYQEDYNKFIKEIEAQKIASSLGIAPKVLSYDLDNHFIVMEFIDGFTLSKLEKTPDLLKNVYRTLDILYDAGIKHNDIHDENIIVKNRKIYIIDYGMSEIYQGPVPIKERNYTIDVMDDMG